MFSLRSILFAAAAFATFTSAIPTPETSTSSTGTSLSGLPALGGAGGSLVPNLGGVGARGEEVSCGDRIQKCRDDIKVKSDKIR